MASQDVCRIKDDGEKQEDNTHANPPDIHGINGKGTGQGSGVKIISTVISTFLREPCRGLRQQKAFYARESVAHLKGGVVIIITTNNYKSVFQ